jgi:hypothetical protein
MKWNTSLPQNSSATEDNYLNAVALLGSSDRIWAVGYSRTTSGVLKTLAEFYYAGWNLTSPENAGTLANVFNGVEEISGGAGGVGIATTWAVGYSQNTSSVKRTLIERYVQSAPSREP